VIVDAHAHIGDYSPAIPGGDHSAEELVDRWDAAGVDCGVISVLGDDPAASNDKTRAACECFPGRIFGYVYLNPTDVEGSLRELDRCAGHDSFRGVKFHPMNNAYYPFIEDYYPVYARVEELGLPMLWHSGTSPYSHPLQIAFVARRFPRIPFILGHFALSDLTWECFPAAELADNIMVDTTANPIVPVIDDWLRRFGSERMLWGSDFPFYDVAYELVKIDHLTIEPEAKRQIVCENARRLFRLKEPVGA
jgi:uncharacterized protein